MRHNSVRGFRQFCSTLLIGVGCLSVCGCSHFWDCVTAKSPEGRFGPNMAYRWQLLTQRPDPFVVLRDSPDGDLRARAYRRLRDEYDGDAEKKRTVLQLLAKGASEETQPLCRLAAVESLGQIKSPAASKALIDAFYAPVNFGDKNSLVRVEVIRSLSEVGDAGAVEMISDAVRLDPAPEVRLAAAKSLGGFQDYRATQSLVEVLKTEKDLALRTEATASLQNITGKDFPDRAEAWESFIQQSTPEVAKERRRRSILPVAFGK